MLSLLDNIKHGILHRFHGGIHPNAHKVESNTQPIRRLSLAPQLVLPLKQHVGQAGDLLVKVGDNVLKGQPLTHGETGLTVPIHASTSGTVIAIENSTIPHPSGLSELCVILQPDGHEKWGNKFPIENYKEQPSHILLEAIRQAGISGLGGAGFPTHRKLQSGLEHIEVLVINGAECESYITADDRLMRDHAKDIILGAEILEHILQPKITIIAIEDNKKNAIHAMHHALKARNNGMTLTQIPTKYPSGGSKQLIELLTGRQVPSHGHSNEIGVIVQNTGTAYAIGRAILHGEPLLERVVTVTGNQVNDRGNYWVPLGTPIEHILNQTQYTAHHQHPRLILGGALMGFTLQHTQIPITKTCNCILLPDTKELPIQKSEMPCIRCGDCAEVCPMKLQPQHLFMLAKNHNDEACQEAHINDCIECGACAYVCPSEIPLVHYYRQSKARQTQVLWDQQKADRARLRFEAKKTRAEREKQQKAIKAQQAAKQRQQNSPQTQQTDVAAAISRVKQSEPRSAVAEAIARAKAKQAEAAAQGQSTPDNTEMMKLREERKRQAREKKAQKEAMTQNAPITSTASSKQEAVAAAIARAKAKKAQQTATSPTIEPASPEVDDKKASVAAAIARAKAKKAQQTATSPTIEPASPEVDNKKAAVASAIARAKAKKAQQTATSPTIETSAPEVDEKKAAVSAAIARAKAKKAQQIATSPTIETSAPEVDEKKAAVAAAIARAKAKKAQQTATSPTIEPASPKVDEKKAAVAAAIARAKAKKAARNHEDK